MIDDDPVLQRGRFRFTEDQSIRCPNEDYIGQLTRILVVASDQTDLDRLLSETLVAIPGVRRLTPALAVDVLKNQPDWVPFHDA